MITSQYPSSTYPHEADQLEPDDDFDYYDEDQEEDEEQHHVFGGHTALKFLFAGGVAGAGKFNFIISA